VDRGLTVVEADLGAMNRGRLCASLADGCAPTTLGLAAKIFLKLWAEFA